MKMETVYYFTIGSSAVTMYQLKHRKLEQIEEKSFSFRTFFNEQDGITNKNYNLLIQYMKQLVEKYGLNKDNTKLYATGIWRKIPKEQAINLVADLRNIGLELNVLSFEQENYYLAKAMQGIYSGKKVLIVNMGEKTTQLVVIDKGNIKEKENLNIGTADVKEAVPDLNNPNANLKIETVINVLLEQLKQYDFDIECDCAIHIGGELKFQTLVGYQLVPNTIFHDGIHEKMVSLDNFIQKNEQLYKEISLEQLKSLMPENPTWMESAKAGVLLAQAIFEKAKVAYIIPSDLNLIHGIIKEEHK